MKRIITEKHVLITLLLVAAVLRLWKLGSIPPGLTPDEAAIGYNAYSILLTGKDEYGQLLPVIFKSFGDFKPGLEVYLTVPFVAILGLTEFAVRLPSVIAGTVAVFLIYIIVKKFLSYESRVASLGSSSKKSKYTPNTLQPTTYYLLPLFSAFLLAINPWHIHYSRGAWEIDIVLTLTLAGIYYFLRSREKANYLIFSAVFFALTLLTYQGAKLSTLIVVVVLIAVFWQDVILFFRNNFKTVARSGIIAIIIITPIILSLFQGRTGRLEVFSVFSYPRSTPSVQELLAQGNERIGSMSYYLYHSEGLNFTRAVLGRYFNHFSTRFLFFEGDWQNPRHSAPNHGMLLIGDLVLLGIGLYVLANIRGKFKYFIILWLLLAPLPAALTRDQVHAVRAFNMVIPLVMLSGLGAAYLFDRIRNAEKVWLKVVGFSVFITFYFLSFIYFLDAYFVHLPVHNAKHWFYGYREMVNTVTPLQQGQEKIVVQQSYNQPYIYFLFYQKYSPEKYQALSKLNRPDTVDVGLVDNLDNISFQKTSWPVGGAKPGEIVVVDGTTATKDVIGEDWEIIEEIKYPDDYQTAFWVFQKI